MVDAVFQSLAEALGHADRGAVVRVDEADDALLVPDLLYLYERHVKAGKVEKAARVCRRALTDASLSAVAHDQMRTVWEQLLEAARRQAVSQESLRDLRQYLNVHWKHPAATPPVVSLR
jgi:hypothetical protein